MTEQDLNDDEIEGKIEKLEEIADEIGLDVEDLMNEDIEDLGVSGTFTLTVYDEDGNEKEKRVQEL